MQTSITELVETDRALKLLAGDSFDVDLFTIEPITLRMVKDLGYTKYNHYLGVLTFRVEDLMDMENVESQQGLSVFEMILVSGNMNLIDLFLDAICFFLKEDKRELRYHAELGLIFGDINVDLDSLRIVNSENYDRIVEVIKYQNYLGKGNAAGYNPKDNKAKSIIERLKRANEIVSRKKKAAETVDTTIDFQIL